MECRSSWEPLGLGLGLASASSALQLRRAMVRPGRPLPPDAPAPLSAGRAPRRASGLGPPGQKLRRARTRALGVLLRR